MSTADILGEHRIIPVVVFDDDAQADMLGAALVAGGLPIAEITLRTPKAVALLRRLAARGDMNVGAGTVLTAAQVDLVYDAGARFVVSPGLGVEVVRRCQVLGLPVIPGISTASEIMAALDLGLDTVKFFPAEACGGLPTVSALSTAFPQVRFIPTGGLTAESAPVYLSHPAVAAVGGSWMVAADLLASAQWDEVASRCSATVSTATFASEPHGAHP